MTTAEEKQAFKVLFSSPNGLDVLDLINKHCGFQKTVFNMDSARQTDFNLGKQEVANWIQKKLKQE